MKKKLAMLLAATMLATLFTGCGAGGKEDKGELNLYTWDGMFPQEILDGFEKETGIRINYSNFDYDEDMLAKLEETKGGDYDLVIADDYIIELAIQEGLAQKLDTSRISTYDNLNPVFMSQFYDPQNEYTVPYGAGIPLIVYDPGLTDVKITGYEDLWDPALENNVALTANYRVIDKSVVYCRREKHFPAKYRKYPEDRDLHGRRDSVLLPGCRNRQHHQGTGHNEK